MFGESGAGTISWLSLRIYLTDMRVVPILSSSSRQLYFPKLSFIDAAVKVHLEFVLPVETMWLCGERNTNESAGVSEHSGEHEDLRELVHRAGSRGRALTLVSFTKGVSPPQRSALSTRSFTPWGSQKKGPHQKHSRDAALLPFLLKTQREQNNSLSTCTPLPPTSSLNTHWVVRSVCLRHLATPVSAVPQLPALRRSLMHMDINWSICPLIRQWRPKGERGLGDLGDKVALRHDTFLSQKLIQIWS